MAFSWAVKWDELTAFVKVERLVAKPACELVELLDGGMVDKSAVCSDFVKVEQSAF